MSVSLEMSSENITDNPLEQVNHLEQVGKNVVNILTTPDIPIHCHKPYGYDLKVTIELYNKLPEVIAKAHAFQDIRAGDFYFDSTELPIYLRSPEIIGIIISECCIKTSLNDNYGFDLKESYKAHPVFHTNDKMNGLELTEYMMKTYYKYHYEKSIGKKYALIGKTDEYETAEQRIENFIHTGRADRIVSPHGPTGPGTEHTVDLLLKEYKKPIKTTKVLVPSFKTNKFERVAKGHKWIRVVSD